jgi:hypothetical protein
LSDILAKERDFMLQRTLMQHRRIEPRCYGISSDALALYALGLGPRPRVPGRPVEPGRTSWLGAECGDNYPADADDLAACRITYNMAPGHLQKKMRPVLDEFRAWVEEGKNRYGEVVMPRGNSGRLERREQCR